MPFVLCEVVILFLTNSLEVLEPPCSIKAEKQGEAKCFSWFLCRFPEHTMLSPQRDGGAAWATEESSFCFFLYCLLDKVSIL